MRRFAFAALALVSACATQTPSATKSDEPPVGGSRAATEVRVSGAWAFAFDAGPGVATAALQGPNGLSARISCQAPAGEMNITDWAFTRTRQGDVAATLIVGGRSKQVLGRVTGTGDGRQALTLSLSPTDPVFNALTPTAEIRVNADGYTHLYATGAASRVSDVINACRPTGS